MEENKVTIHKIDENLFVGAISIGYEFDETTKTIISQGKTKEEALENAANEILKTLKFNQKKISEMLQVFGEDDCLKDDFYTDRLEVNHEGDILESLYFFDEENQWFPMEAPTFSVHKN